MAVISVSGKIYAGKDQVAKYIQGFMPNHNWEIKKYAGKLKLIGSIILGVPVEKFEDREFKESYLPKEWDVFRCRFTGKYGNDQFGRDFVTKAEAVAYEKNERMSLQWPSSLKTVIKRERMKIREFMQRLGTEGIRVGLHQQTWVNAMYSDYVDDGSQGMYPKYPNWIITDTRFVNELKGATDRKAITIKVTRKETDAQAGTHLSETALDHYKKWNYVIKNDGTMEDLKEQVRQILIKEGLI